MATKIDSENLHASSGSALISPFLEFTSAAVVIIDESQKIVAFGGYTDNRISVRFEYEWRDESDQWYRTHGNEHWEFDEEGLMRRRDMRISLSPLALGFIRTART